MTKRRQNRPNSPSPIEKTNIAKQQPTVNLQQKMAQRVEHFSGPLPPPEIFSKYDQILPGSAERILAMAENQSNHRMRLESESLRGGNRDSLLGIIAAFIIAMTTICSGTYVIVSGHPIYGTILSGSGLIGVVGAFIYGTNARRFEREQERIKNMED